ncbi:hypothetical protein PK98_05420 [Croceibacterium mercuriale]|uniref:Uncharacterized protein n=1 Tax=Croceibacterium mercuriale TaxID=1572751 RepID=A0A0B2C138_9SPHN|nr:hypothetical protein PK98_05420 [Croceibacterium mercuriale]
MYHLRHDTSPDLNRNDAHGVLAIDTVTEVPRIIVAGLVRDAALLRLRVGRGFTHCNALVGNI